MAISRSSANGLATATNTGERNGCRHFPSPVPLPPLLPADHSSLGKLAAQAREFRIHIGDCPWSSRGGHIGREERRRGLGRTHERAIQAGGQWMRLYCVYGGEGKEG